jgi:cytochrome P450
VVATDELFSPEFFVDPYPIYAGLRAQDPLQETAFGPWLLLRYDDVNRVLRDPAVSVAFDDDLLDDRIEQVLGRPRRPSAQPMLRADPPDHTRLRRLVQKAFTPRVIADLRPLVEQLVDTALDEFDTTGTVDIIGDLAFPLPFLVISRMLGMPETDAARLRDWSHTMTKTLDPILSDDDIRAASDAEERMNAFLLDVFEWKRSEPADDLLTALIAAEDAGDVLSDEELLAQVSLLFIAGHETTVNLIGNGTYALLRNRDQWERLVREPALDANVADELLRYDSPVQFSGRTVLTDVALEGKTLPAGSSTMVCLGAANRDPARWGDTAESLDLERVGANQHVSFGGGVHHCLGSALARLEGQIAISRMARRFPRMELASDTPAWNGRLVLRGLDELPVTIS